MGIVELGHTGAYIQTLSYQLVCTPHFVVFPKIHLKKKKKNTIPTPALWNGGCIVLFMSVWDTLHHMANQAPVDVR